jgi:hypothetical protein
MRVCVPRPGTLYEVVALQKLQVAPHTGRESERVRHASLLRCWEWNRTEGGLLNAGRVRFGHDGIMEVWGPDADGEQEDCGLSA